MICAHCNVHYHPDELNVRLEDDMDNLFTVVYSKCPNCSKNNISLHCQNRYTPSIKKDFLVFPYLLLDRLPAPSEVPEYLANDFNEACAVFHQSAKASAALSRRCLQLLLIEYAKVDPKKNLSEQIQDVIDGKSLPPYLSENIDYIRNIGNFAAHPIKTTHTGEIIDVEPGEAEWNLDILEQLFSFYILDKKKIEDKRKALAKTCLCW